MAPFDEALGLFGANIQIVKKAFRWQDGLTIRLGALIVTASGKLARSEALREAKGLVKQNAGPFSNLRGAANLPLAALLTTTDDPPAALHDTITVQDLLKAQKFHRNDYLVLAAAHIALNTAPDTYAPTAARAREFFDAMKRGHSLITGDDDYLACCLLALSGLPVEPTNAEIEELMTLLEPYFGARPGTRQTLAQVLCLGQASTMTARPPQLAVARTIAVREALREAGLNTGTDIAAALGVLSLLPGEPTAIATQVAECFTALKADPAFGRRQGKQATLLFAASLVTLSEADTLRATADATLAGTITNLIIAQQITVILAASAAGAAAAASSAS